MSPSEQASAETQSQLMPLLAGAGLTLASLIILPALAQRAGLNPALTGALRAVLMKASNKV
jgi:hypothetical protein